MANYIQLQIDINKVDIIVYSSGCNDLNSGVPYEEVFSNYNKLIRGIKQTYLIIPPLQPQIIYDKFIDSELLDDNFILLFIWYNDYKIINSLYPTEENIGKLENELNKIISDTI